MYLCITVPYREEGGGGGLPKPPSPSPQPTGIYVYAWHSFLGHQMYSGIVHQRTDSAKTDKPSSGIKIVHQGTDSAKTDKPFSGNKIVHQRTDSAKTDKPSPGTSLEVTREQTTPRQTSLPLAPLSKLPGDRLHQDRQAFPWHLSRSYQRTNYIE